MKVNLIGSAIAFVAGTDGDELIQHIFCIAIFHFSKLSIKEFSFLVECGHEKTRNCGKAISGQGDCEESSML